MSWSDGSRMSVPAREIECFLMVAEELHFGRAGDRLYLSQGRVSQLIQRFERLIGGQLFDRTSRRVQLTELGIELRETLGPAYGHVTTAIHHAQARAVSRVEAIRVGFQCAFYDHLSETVAEYERSHPGIAVEPQEIPFHDPFGSVLSGTVDTAIALLPVSDSRIVVGLEFAELQRKLVLSARHPLARRASITAEELADITLVSIAEGAPAEWREFHSPTKTPSGAPIRTHGEIRTVQEGITRASTGNVAFLLCESAANYHLRSDIVGIPVTGLPPSRLGLVWLRQRETAQTKGFARALATVI